MTFALGCGIRSKHVNLKGRLGFDRNGERRDVPEVSRRVWADSWTLLHHPLRDRALTRKLVHVSIIHAEADLGSLAEKLGAVGEQILSPNGWNRHQQEVAAFWERLRAALVQRIEKELEGASWERLRIYQDGLPSGGETARRIVEELAEKGSPNYQIVRELLQRGAQIEMTEHAGLLREEYRLIRGIVAASGPVEKMRAEQAYRRRSAALLAERDRFIAKRIDEGLKEAEVGLLFIGASHRVMSYLPGDIEVVSVS